MRGSLYYLIIIMLWAVPVTAREVPTYQAPLSLTVEKILSNPWRYHDETVKITGVFNECVGYSCEICDGVEPVDPYADGNEGLCFGVSFIDTGMERLARFSTITVVGQYDAGCSGVPQNKFLKDDDIIICTDRATQLEYSYITGFTVKRPPVAGHISSYGDEELIMPTPLQNDTLIADFKSVLPSDHNVDDSEIYHAYFFNKRDDTPYQIGGVCVCFDAEDEPCETPKREGDTYLESAVDNYSCYPAEYRDGRWVFSPLR